MSAKMKKTIYQYAMVTLACVMMSIAINVFYMPNKLLSGGIGGFAVLVYYIAGLPMGVTSLICNIPLFVIAYKYLDKAYTINAFYGMLMFAFCLDFFHFLSEYTIVHDTLLACIAGGVFYGIGASCMYRVGGSSFVLKHLGMGMTMFKGCKVIEEGKILQAEAAKLYIKNKLKGQITWKYHNPYGDGRIKFR